MMLLLMEPTFHLQVQNFSHFSYFSELRVSYWLVPVIETMVLLILFLVSVVGNIGAIVRIIQERRLTNTSILTMNLFLADLLFVSTVPFVIAVRWTKEWKLGSAACHLILYFISVSGVITSTTLAGISIERLLAILKMETTPSLNPRWTLGVLFLIWFLCAAAMLPLSLFSRVITVSSPPQGEMHICTLIWPHINVEIVWYAVFLALGFLVPGSSIVICYTKILQIKKRSQRRLHVTKTTSQRQAETSAVSKQDYRLFRTLLILIISFFIMWGPIFIFTFLILIHNIQAHLPITSSMFVWVLTFTMANSALNPVLYSLCQLKHRWLCCATAITPGPRAVTQ